MLQRWRPGDGDAIRVAPWSRWDVGALELVDGRTVARFGGFLDGVELFDWQAFGMSRSGAVN